MKPLLTPKQVANLLQVSTRTVYDNKHRLRGFYPVGIRRLRFRAEDIDELLEESQDRQVLLRVPVPKEEIYRQRIQNEKGLRRGQRGSQKRGKIKTNPDRWGL
jgi:excisionase family DNA binding protein